MARITRRHVLTLLSAVPAVHSTDPVLAIRPKASDPRLFFVDLLRFEASAGAESIGRWVERYLAEPSPGLAAYMKTYSVTSSKLEEALAAHPIYYRQLVGLRARIRPEEKAILEAMARIRAFAPMTPPVPVYFLVGTLGPGATPREVTPQGGEHGLGILVPVEIVAFAPITDMSEFPEGRCGRGDVSALPSMVAHEYTHVAQIQLQGLERYRSIYREAGRNTNLAFAIREGGADFGSILASGQLRERHRYMLANEAQLWREFEPVLDQPVSSATGWFSTSTDARCGRPGQLGYALGWAMCRRFYDAATDKRAAIRTILSAVEPAEFDAVSAPYRAVRGR